MYVGDDARIFNSACCSNFAYWVCYKVQQNSTKVHAMTLVEYLIWHAQFL